jgi:hypothetical protein
MATPEIFKERSAQAVSKTKLAVSQEYSVLALITQARARLAELNSQPNLERRKEVLESLEEVRSKLDEISPEIVPQISRLVARDVQPFYETLRGSDCNFRHVRLPTSLIQRVKTKGVDVCEACQRLLLR